MWTPLRDDAATQLRQAHVRLSALALELPDRSSK
jgi:hypothetical protein